MLKEKKGWRIVLGCEQRRLGAVEAIRGWGGGRFPRWHWSAGYVGVGCSGSQAKLKIFLGIKEQTTDG